MSNSTKEGIYLGLFWLVITFLSVFFTDRDRGTWSRVVDASKSSAIAFVFMFIVAKGCAHFRPIGDDGPDQCEHYPAIYGC